MADNPDLMLPEALDKLSSDALAAILGGFVGGIVGGMLSVIAAFGAQYLQHRLRRTGKVRCAVHSIHVGNPEPMVSSFAFPLVFRNEKEVDIAIDELNLTVWDKGKCLVKTPVFEEDTGQIIAYLELPARKMVHKSVAMRFVLPGDMAKRIRDSRGRICKLSWTYTSGRRVTRLLTTDMRGRWHAKWYRRLWHWTTEPFRRPCEKHNPEEPIKRAF
jgi:hypothetical protein